MVVNVEVTNRLDLEQLGLQVGDSQTIDLLVGLDGFTWGGIDYELTDDGKIPITLAVSKMAHGFVLDLVAQATIIGPCVRCLDPTELDLQIHAYQVNGSNLGDQSTPYVDEGILDVSSFLHDELALATPEKILCREDCKGLCAICAKNLNEEPHTHAPEPDPRWSALKNLEL